MKSFQLPKPRLHIPDTKAFPANLPAAGVCLRREKDIEHFLETSRNKFIGFTLGRWLSETPSTVCFRPLS